MRNTGFCMVLLLAGCISFKGNLKGFYSGYDTIGQKYPGLLVKSTSDDAVCTVAPTLAPKVLVVNGKQVRACLEKTERAVVYVWQPLCKGEFCYALSVVQRECRKKKIDLYVVAEYYEDSMNDPYLLDRPILGIDTDYYRSDRCDNYVPKFIHDVIGTPERNTKFIAFKEGIFERTFDRLEAL